MVGSQLSAFVLAVWVLDRTGSVTQFAVISAVGTLPGILLGPVGGAVADRFDRRRVMLAGDAVAACGMGAIAVALLAPGGNPRLWQILVAVCVTSVASAFQRPAFLAAVSQLVPKRYLGHTSGVVQLGVSLGVVLAPLLGAGLYAAAGLAGAVLVDAATFVAGVATLLAVRLPDRAWRRRDEPFLVELRSGWRYVMRRPGLRAALRFFVVDHAFYTLGFAVLVPYLLTEHSVAVLGVALSAGGLGGLAAALAMSVSGGVPRRVHGMLLSMAVSSVGMIVVAADRPSLAVAGLFVMTFGEVFAEAHWIAFVQRKVGLDLQGRVQSIFITVMLLTVPVGYLVVGPLAERLVQPLLVPGGAWAGSVGAIVGVGPARGLALLVLLSGVLCLLWAAAGWAMPQLRDLERTLPDAVPSGRIGDRDAVQREADRTHGVGAPTGAR